MAKHPSLTATFFDTHHKEHGVQCFYNGPTNLHLWVPHFHSLPSCYQLRSWHYTLSNWTLVTTLHFLYTLMMVMSFYVLKLLMKLTKRTEDQTLIGQPPSLTARPYPHSQLGLDCPLLLHSHHHLCHNIQPHSPHMATSSPVTNLTRATMSDSAITNGNL